MQIPFGRRGPFTFADNAWLVQGPYDRAFFSLTRTTDVTIRNNQVDSRPRAPAAVKLVDSEHVGVTGNTFRRAARVFDADDVSADYWEEDNTTQ